MMQQTQIANHLRLEATLVLKVAEDQAKRLNELADAIDDGQREEAKSVADDAEFVPPF